MGGNALSVPSVRLEAAEFIEFLGWVDACLKCVSWMDGNTAWRPTMSYGAKESFGDCDMLVVMHPQDWQSIIDTGGAVFGATEIYNNGKVVSLGIPWKDKGLFQLDLINTPPAEFDWAQFYFSFNDMGNLLGRLAHTAGFKLGHDGLWYVYRDPENTNRVLHEFLVTRDIGEALLFLGLDPDVWYQATEPDSEVFYRLESMFDYVMSSPLFMGQSFALSERNHAARIRDRKRATYNKFLEYIASKADANTELFGYEYSQQKQWYRATYFWRAFTQFPDFALEYSLEYQRIAQRRHVTTLFNGNLAREIAQEGGARLGQMMVLIATRNGGKSMLGDAVLAAAKSPDAMDQWVYDQVTSAKEACQST